MTVTTFDHIELDRAVNAVRTSMMIEHEFSVACLEAGVDERNITGSPLLTLWLANTTEGDMQ